MMPNTQMKEYVDEKVQEFLKSMEKMYFQFNYDIPWQKQKIHDTFLTSLLPNKYICQTGQYFQNFFKTTIVNEAENRRRSHFLGKDFSEFKDPYPLFQNESMNSQFNGNSVKEKQQNFKQGIFGQYQEIHENKEIQYPQKKQSMVGADSYIDQMDQKIYKNYSDKKKMNILDYADMYGIKIASRYYNLPSYRIKLWKKKGQRTINRGRKPVDPEMQMNLVNWLKISIQQQKYITQKLIRKKARQLSNSKQFKASKGWLEKFFKRNSDLFQKYLRNKDNYVKNVMKKDLNIQPPQLLFQQQEVKKEQSQDENINMFDSLF